MFQDIPPSTPKNIGGLREEIDGIDEKIVALLAERHRRVTEIGEIKGKSGKPIIDSSRESAKMRQIAAWTHQYGVPVFYAVLPMKIIMLASSIAQGFNPSVETKEFRCVSCNWNTAGIYDPELKWKVCPSCNSPLFFPRTEKKKMKSIS